MTPSNLKYHVENTSEESHFFTRSSMKFAGDTMANFGCRSATATDSMGTTHEVWELYRKRKTTKGFASSFYFAKDTFERILA